MHAGGRAEHARQPVVWATSFGIVAVTIRGSIAETVSPAVGFGSAPLLKAVHAYLFATPPPPTQLSPFHALVPTGAVRETYSIRAAQHA